MGFLNQTNADGSPNISAAFVNAVLISSLYHLDENPPIIYAGISGSTIRVRRVDPGTYEPDYVIFGLGGAAYVVMAGTTNYPQWLGHAASALCPWPDTVTSNIAVASFLLGYQQREDEIVAAINPAIRSRLIFTGHSYGGAACNIAYQRIQANFPQGRAIDLMTFGEPKSYGKIVQQVPATTHNRLIAASDIFNDGRLEAAGIDPVSLLPPNGLLLAGVGWISKLSLGLLGFTWQHVGQPWLLRSSNIVAPGRFGAETPVLDALVLAYNLDYISLHYMDTSYLTKITNQYVASGLNPELAPLLPFAYRYMGSPSVPPTTLGPPLSTAVLNSGFGQVPPVVTDANRTEFSTITSSARIFYFERATNMPAPVIPPTFKGTFFFDQDEGGSSESFYTTKGASDPTNTYAAMLATMKTLATFRTRLSIMDGNGQCQNPLKLQAIRVENENLARDSVLVSDLGISGPSYATPGKLGFPGLITPLFAASEQNDANDTAVKVIFVDGFGHSATMYLHGIPLFAQESEFGTGEYVPGNYDSRIPPLKTDWKQALYNFANALVDNNIGLRYATVQWTPGAIAVGSGASAIAASGNGTPLGITYNSVASVGNLANTYTLQMPQQQGISSGNFIANLRSFKNLRVLNGRWPAWGYTSGGMFFVNIKHRCANYTPWDGQGYMSPLVWSVMTPALSPPRSGANVPGVASIELTAKKVGRPFDLQRGRARVRVT